MKFSAPEQNESQRRDVQIPAGEVTLNGELVLPDNPLGVVLFVHGSGSSRCSPRNQFVAQYLQASSLGTLLFDLLTEEEEQKEFYTRHLRFDIPLLAERLLQATEWLQAREEADSLRLGYFGSSTGAAAALIAAASDSDNSIGAVVSRGGRPDLAAKSLKHVRAPTLLIVGGRDLPVLDLNEAAFESLQCEKVLRILPGATHLFEEPGALEQVARLAAEWFSHYLRRSHSSREQSHASYAHR